MKTLYYFFAIFCLTLVNFSCSAQKKTTVMKSKTTIEKISLEEVTRGTRRIVLLTPKQKTVEINGRITPSTSTAKQWDFICKNIATIPLSKLNTYEGTSTDRYFDGALAATIRITSGGKEYESKTFDSGKPPKELEIIYHHLAKEFK